MPTLKERIQSLTSSINQAKTSLRDALRNKGVDPGSQPSFEALRLGIERIPSKMVMAPDKSTVSIIVNCNLDSIQSALDEIDGCYYKGDLVVIVTYTIPIDGNYGLCIYNLSEDLFSYFSGYGSSIGMKNGYPWVENSLFLESVDITAVNTGRYDFSFTGYLLKEPSRLKNLSD
jgi:hypothetical protein